MTIKASGHPTMPSPKCLVYGCFPFGDRGQLIIREESNARGHAVRLHALWTAKTLGDIKKALDPDEFAELCDDLRECEHDAFVGATGRPRKHPDLSAEFDGQNLFAVDDSGRWIGDPTKEMLFFVPKDVLDQYGKLGDSYFNQSVILFPEFEKEIVARLIELGHTIRRDDLLVSAGWDADNAARVVGRVKGKAV